MRLVTAVQASRQVETLGKVASTIGATRIPKSTELHISGTIIARGTQVGSRDCNLGVQEH